MLIEVGTPDADSIYAQAADWSNPDMGLITFMVPPVVDRLSDVIRPMVEAIGGATVRLPASGESVSVESALGRLRAHGIHSAIVLHGHWMPTQTFSEFVSAAALIGIDLFVITHPDNDGREIALDWRSAVWGWADLRSWIARSVAKWQEAALAPLRHQRVPMPLLGLHRPRPVMIGRLRPGHAEEAFTAVRHRLSVAPPAHHVATVLRQALLAAPSKAFDAVVDGAAAAIAETGYLVLRSDGDPEVLAWRSLRRIPDVTAAAALTLFALGFDERACARLLTRNVDLDLGRIRVGRHVTEITPAAIPYLAAQRFARLDGGEGFLKVDGHAASPQAVRRLVVDALRGVGRTLDEQDFSRGLSPSQRWLLERGLLVRRTPAAGIARLTGHSKEAQERRCRHGLAAWVEVAGCDRISHSQRLCLAADANDLRMWSSDYVVEPIEVVGDASAFVVLMDGEDRGSLWRVATPLGHVWMQSHARQRPQTAEVARAVWCAQLQPSSRGQRAR